MDKSQRRRDGRTNERSKEREREREVSTASSLFSVRHYFSFVVTLVCEWGVMDVPLRLFVVGAGFGLLSLFCCNETSATQIGRLFCYDLATRLNRYWSCSPRQFVCKRLLCHDGVTLARWLSSAFFGGVSAMGVSIGHVLQSFA